MPAASGYVVCIARRFVTIIKIGKGLYPMRVTSGIMSEQAVQLSVLTMESISTNTFRIADIYCKLTAP